MPRAESVSSPSEQRSSPDSATSGDSKADPTEARTFGWLSIAVGAESAIVATVTSVLILEDKGTRDSDCNADRVCSSSGFNANTQIGALAVWNAGAWILAAAGLGVGSYLLLTHSPARTTVSLSPSGGSLVGSF
jgi:hypothetical protein